MGVAIEVLALYSALVQFKDLQVLNVIVEVNLLALRRSYLSTSGAVIAKCRHLIISITNPKVCFVLRKLIVQLVHNDSTNQPTTTTIEK